MPLNELFIAFIAIVTIIRLGLIMTGPMDAREKTTKAGYWVVGLVLVIISWIALGELFGVNTNGFQGRKTTDSTTTGFDGSNGNVNSNTYYGTGYEENTGDVPVTVNPH